MATDALFQPLQIGAVKLQHRIVMAPLTRMRSRQPGDAPHALNAEYYGQRASQGGLIIAEATDISEHARGYPGAPGSYSDEQVATAVYVTNDDERQRAYTGLKIQVHFVEPSSGQPLGSWRLVGNANVPYYATVKVPAKFAPPFSRGGANFTGTLTVA